MQKALLAFIAGAVVSGCGVEVLTTTAIVSDLNKTQAQSAANQLAKTRDFSSKVNLEGAVKAYYGEKGAYPPSLQALVPDYIQSVPLKPDGTPFGYDPATGTVLEHPNPAADAQALQQIRDAIQRYGMATGYYPPSLQALVPTHLAVVPKTSDGQDFYYNPLTGELRHPGQNASTASSASARPSPSAPAAGGGPVGEALTGIGIQGQLNNMSNTGVSAAGSRMRSGLGGAQQQHEQQQEKALSELGP
ncbi:MAG TPA: hypothetical protein PKZ01_04430 [Candidatus Hydrogenedentes bacterium]|nr:hypothetical protein [Candidatus Hydrogenedentota bacterium]